MKPTLPNNQSQQIQLTAIQPTHFEWDRPRAIRDSSAKFNRDTLNIISSMGPVKPLIIRLLRQNGFRVRYKYSFYFRTTLITGT